MLARQNEYAHPLASIDREFGRVLNRLWSGEVPSTLAPYAVDVHEDANHFYVEAELPGFTKDEVDVTLEDGVLTIRGDRKVETPKPDPNGKQPLHVERRWSRFERSFTLPTAVNDTAVQARLNDGLLTITLDKREEVKPRKIHITASSTTNGTHNGAAKS